MDISELGPIVIYDDQCYLCSKFASFVKFFSRGRINFVGHYTEFGKEIRQKFLSSDALEMFWFIDTNFAYGGRAALWPLFKRIITISKEDKIFPSNRREESCDISCKTPKAVLLRSASLLTHSRKIRLSNSST